MGFKEFNDADKDGLNDSAAKPESNKFDLSDSDEIAEKLEREEPKASPEQSEQPEAEKKSPEEKDPPDPESLEEKSGKPETEVQQGQEKGTEPANTGQPESLPEKDPEQVDVRSDTSQVKHKEVDDTPPDGPFRGEQDEQEVHVSRFSSENFRPENSFDAYAKENHPELNELKSKCVYDVQPMGTPSDEIDRSAKDVYTDEERQYIKDIRNSVDAPDERTVMQKVIGVDTGDIEKDLDRYLNPRDFNGEDCEAHVTGCVAKAEDAAPFTKTPQECYDNLRMDYPETPYLDPDQSVYVIRYTNGTNYDMPYSTEFGGDKECAAPMTGNAFTGSEQHIVPESTVRPVNNKGAIVTDGEIYRINPDGTEELVAKFNKQDQCFELQKEENE